MTQFARGTSPYYPGRLTEPSRMVSSIGLILTISSVAQDEDIDDPQAELETLQYWLQVDRCDRRAINRQFRHSAAQPTATAATSAAVPA